MRNEKTKLKIKKGFKLLVVVLSFAFCFFSLMLAKPTMAASASLYLSPSTGTYTVGNTFLVEIKLNSGGAAINAADGTLIFNPNNLEVRSISKEGSIFSLWVQEPTFSNSLGAIDFAGGKPSPGFTGAAGIICTVTFKARTSGNTNLTLAAGSILADDGKGTNILTNMGGGTYTLSARGITPVSPIEEEYIPPSTPGQTPAAPVVSSATHLDENKWYSNNDPEFDWKLPSDATGVSLLLNEKPISNPGPISDGLLESKKYQDIEDGEWYFHIKFKNQYGWGEITHRKVLIDTIPPAIFKVIVDKKGELTNPSPVLYFESTDVPSGIEYYEVAIDREKKAIADRSDIKTNPFHVPLLTPGTHLVEVKAFDKAGNFTLAATEIEITPIESPEITKIPISVKVGDILEIKGKALAGVTVRIYLQKGEEEPILEKVKADSEGNFVLSYDKALSKGDYLVWAQAENEKGALSNPTKKYALEVGLPPFLKIGKIVLDYLTTMITLIILIVGAIAVIFYTWYRISLWRKRVRKETKEVGEAVNRAFRALREEVEEQIEFLDGKPGLTKTEREVRNKLKEALGISEEFIGKEIKDVEKELE